MQGALRLVVVCAALAACKSNPSPLDKTVGKEKIDPTKPADPWSTFGAKKSGDDAKDDGALGGFDIKGILQKVAESMEKPGPYEAPEKSADFDETKPHWGVLGMGGNIVEREAYSFSFFGGSSRGNELRKVINRLREFAKDEKLTGLLLRVEEIDVSLPDVIELRTAMHDFRKAGKKLVCHTEGATNATYLVLAACERIGMAPLGGVTLTGPAAMPIHVKPLLDKLGVTADFLHVGAYKGAAEPLTRDAPSNEMRETLQGILDRHYATLVDIVAKERKMQPAEVQTLVDTALFTSPQAKTAKLVDDVVSFEVFRDANLDKASWTKLELEPSAGKDQIKAMMQLARFFGAMPPERPMEPHVAVVYALGNIVDGNGDGVLGARQEIASHTLVAALRAIAKDDDVKAVVLRIDSGGGSAQASELIWEAVALVKAKKPVIVSMSDVAASGGYYIAAGATKIYAQEDTLTGSIGVVGGKIAPGAALANLGIKTYPMGKGKRATMMASLAPWTPDEKAVIQASMDDVYKTFVGRVAEGRKKKLEDILPIAQGRVWTGAKAKELGLVDEIGGLDAALAEARTLAKVDATADMQIYPPSPTLRDFLSGFSSGVSAGPFGAELATLRAIDPRLARAAEDLLHLVMSFQKTQDPSGRGSSGNPMKRALVLLAVAACSNSGSSSSTNPQRQPTVDPTPAVVAPAASAKGNVITDRFASAALGVEKNVVIYLPANYEASTKRYPVFYYLHGLGGEETNWTSGGKLHTTADELGLEAIIVMPDGDDGFYVNSPKQVDYDACMKDGTGLFFPQRPKRDTCIRASKYETYVIDDLIKHVDGKYRTIATREGRAIAGLSMGGFGALHLAMRHPDRFVAAASHSGIDALLYGGPVPYAKGKVTLVSDVKKWGDGLGPFGTWIRNIFGPDLATWKAYDPATLAGKLAKDGPAIYLDCGTEDEFMLHNGMQYLHDLLLEKGIDHAYYIGPGKHDFSFWSVRVKHSLEFLRGKAAKPN